MTISDFECIGETYPDIVCPSLTFQSSTKDNLIQGRLTSWDLLVMETHTHTEEYSRIRKGALWVIWHLRQMLIVQSRPQIQDTIWVEFRDTPTPPAPACYF